jgi:hypothetical protein
MTQELYDAFDLYLEVSSDPSTSDMIQERYGNMSDWDVSQILQILIKILDSERDPLNKTRIYFSDNISC